MSSSTKRFFLPWSQLQPSQLYISREKLQSVASWLNVTLAKQITLPVILIQGQYVLSDGHTRAYACWKLGMDGVFVSLDLDELDRNIYETCVHWCKEANITEISNLTMLTQEQYEICWIKRCLSIPQTKR